MLIEILISIEYLSSRNNIRELFLSDHFEKFIEKNYLNAEAPNVPRHAKLILEKIRMLRGG